MTLSVISIVTAIKDALEVVDQFREAFSKVIDVSMQMMFASPSDLLSLTRRNPYRFPRTTKMLHSLWMIYMISWTGCG